MTCGIEHKRTEEIEEQDVFDGVLSTELTGILCDLQQVTDEAREERFPVSSVLGSVFYRTRHITSLLQY